MDTEASASIEAPSDAPVEAHREHTGGSLGGLAVAVLGGVGLALAVVTVLGRFDRAPAPWLTALLMLLPWLYAGYATMCFALWSALPDRKGPPLMLSLVLLVGLLTWGRAWAAFAQPSDGLPVRVMTWNVQRLWGLEPDPGGARALECVALGVEDADPDVLALQEVSARDVARLSERLGLSCAHTSYSHDEHPDHGGVAACVRGGRWQLRSGSASRFVDGEDWYYVFSEMERQGRVFNLLVVHLYPYATRTLRPGDDLVAINDTVARGQANQSGALLRRMARLRDPTVVAGDFNSTRDFHLHRALRAHLTDAWEQAGLGFGSTKMAMGLAPLRIDYIYASTETFAVQDARVPERVCSDHQPVVSELVLSDQVPVHAN